MNEHPTFTIILRWDEQQSSYIGQVPEIVGVEGSVGTYEAALVPVLEAIRSVARDERPAIHSANTARAKGVTPAHQTKGNSSIRVVF